jgi:uncharacterized protein (DUF302 family)
MKSILSILSLCFVLVSCGGDDDNGDPNAFNEPTTAGLSYSNSQSDFITTYNGIRATLQSNSNISVLAEVNHTANAQSVNQSLRNTRIIFFGNPTLGTPVMQEKQLEGLDLPQHILVYENASNEVIASYNSVNYLSTRYGVQSANTLPQIESALESIVNTTTQNEVLTNSSASINSGQGVITLVSQNNFSTTYNNLRNSIIDNTNLSLVFELNHQENAQNAGLSLRPTSVIVFGNPNLGTPLMQDSQTTALDLPQKFLVWEDENGEVKVSYNNPNFLKSRHLISNSQNSTLEDITNALNNLAISATN